MASKDKLSLREYPINDPIPAGGKRIVSVLAGSYFYVSEASHASFRLILNDSANIKGRLARGYLFPEGEAVTKIEIRNTHATSPLTLLIEVGRGRPLDEGLNVYTEQITPTVRTENPSVFSKVEVTGTGLANNLELLPLDCSRAEVRLFTDDTGDAFWGPTNDATWSNVTGNQVGITLDGATRLKTCAPIYVRAATGTKVFAYVLSY